MKKTFALTLALMLMLCAGAQEKWPPLDNSPMDVIYLPVDYPILKIRKAALEIPVMKIIYSRPQKKNRKAKNKERKNYGEKVRSADLV